MARYIDADRLRYRVKIATNPYGKPTLEYSSGLKVLVMIDKEPTADVVEVVRCRDCRYYEIHKPTITLNCERDARMIPMNPDGFCSNGERKA